MTDPTPTAGNGGHAFLFERAHMDDASEVRTAAGHAAVITRTSPTSDGDNEDAAAIVSRGPNGALLAVADGFGGGPLGERASHLAVTEITRSVTVGGETGPLRAPILDGFEAANRKILELAVGAATTLAAVGIENGLARPFHSGDSTILVVGGRGKIKWQSVAHSPAGYAVASGWVDEDEARGHDEAQLVSNYLGSPEMRIEIGPELRLAPRDTVLVASDGLIDNLDPEEIAAVVAGAGALTAKLSTLATRAQERMATETGKPDDLTVVAFRLGSRERTGGSRPFAPFRSGGYRLGSGAGIRSWKLTS